MIDPKDDTTGFLLARYVQHHERVLALLEFLAARLDAQGQEDFLVLLGDQAKAEAQADLEAAAVEAQAAGLDAVKIAGDILAAESKLAAEAKGV